MAQPKLGVKRHCLSCGARFYDLHKSPIVCPKCDTIHDPEALFKARRGGKPSNQEEQSNVIPINLLDADPLLDDAVDVDLGDDDQSPLLDDADDLAEDDAMADVIEHIPTDDDR